MVSRDEAVLCRYRYDPLDQLRDCARLGRAKIARFYRKSHLVTELEGNVAHSLFRHDNGPLALKFRQEDRSRTTLMITDQRQSVLQTLRASEHRPISYAPYGNHAPKNGPVELVAFNGERPDPVTGHYMLGNGYRAFNPVLMRFNSPDSQSPFDIGGLNAYAYCLGDPINYVDPTGHLPSWANSLISIGVSLTIGAVSGGIGTMIGGMLALGTKASLASLGIGTALTAASVGTGFVDSKGARAASLITGIAGGVLLGASAGSLAVNRMGFKESVVRNAQITKRELRIKQRDLVQKQLKIDSLSEENTKLKQQLQLLDIKHAGEKAELMDQNQKLALVNEQLRLRARPAVNQPAQGGGRPPLPPARPLATTYRPGNYTKQPRLDYLDLAQAAKKIRS